MVQVSNSEFSYDHRDIKRLELAVKRKMQVLKIFTELKEFDYEAPNMSYDKKTGEINIEEKAAPIGGGKKKKVISNIDDLEKEKQALFAEMGLD